MSPRPFSLATNLEKSRMTLSRSAPHFLRYAPLALTLAAPLGLAMTVLAPRDAWAVGETNGRLKGRVLEAGTGVPVPGMRVDIRSSALQGVRTESTDDNGGYDFLNVPPGTYDVTFSIEGVKPVKRRVTVSIGETRELALQFSAELANVQTEVIIEERRKVDISRANVGRVLTADQQGKVASARSYQDIVQQLPGVSGGSNPVMAGGNFRHNKYLVDGLDITDPVTNTFSANFNFDAINQLEALTIPVDAQYNSLGGIINLITKAGSDQFHVDASFYLNHQTLSGGALAGTRQWEGWRYDQSDPRPPTASYQGNLNLSGPIVKQKLWFYLSNEFRYNLRSVVPGTPLNYQHPSRLFIGYYPRVKLTWRAAQRHQVELSFNADPAWINNIQQLNTYASEAERFQGQGGQFATLSYDWAIKDNVFFKLQTGLVFQRLYGNPNIDDPINPGHFERDAANQIFFGNGSGYRYFDDQRQRFQFDPTVIWVKKGWLGEHTFKAGVQFQFIRQYNYSAPTGNLSYSNSSTGVLLRDPQGYDNPYACNPVNPNPVAGSPLTSCFRNTQYEPAYALSRRGWGLGAFIQDTWKPVSWLTIMPGLRVDYGTAQNSRGEVTHNLLGFGPRIFVSADLTRDGKTALKFAYGRANEVSSLLYAAAILDGGARQSTWQYNNSTGRFDGFLNGAGGFQGYDVRGRCADGSITAACGNAALSLNPPRSDFVTVSLERDLFKNVLARITYTYRLQTWQWEDFYLNEPHTVDGGWYTQFNNTVLGARPTPDAFRRYNGVDFEIDARQKDWFFIASYTLSFLEGSVDDAAGPLYDDPPRNFRLRGYLGDDVRHAIKSQASYTWRGLTVGLNLSFTTGTPSARFYLLPRDGAATGRWAWRGVDPGTSGDPNNIRTWTELRNMDQFVVNLRAQYDIGALFGNKFGQLSAIADVFNALALPTPSTLNTTDGANFAVVSTRLQPIRLQLGLRYQY